MTASKFYFAFTSDKHSTVYIGGGAYWAGRAAACPLFGSCGPPLSLARPLSGGDVNFFFLYIAIMTGENLQ